MNVQVQPSYPHKPKAVENLMKGLPELLEPKVNPSSDSQGTATGAWEIDESGDTIHQHVSMSEEKDIISILRQIDDAARELNHDPHTHVDGTNLTISCTTHVPPGLSMKDVKLAKKIDAILNNFREPGVGLKSPISAEQKERAEKQNMEAIKKAKEDCNCG